MSDVVVIGFSHTATARNLSEIQQARAELGALNRAVVDLPALDNSLTVMARTWQVIDSKFSSLVGSLSPNVVPNNPPVDVPADYDPTARFNPEVEGSRDQAVTVMQRISPDTVRAIIDRGHELFHRGRQLMDTSGGSASDKQTLYRRLWDLYDDFEPLLDRILVSMPKGAEPGD